MLKRVPVCGILGLLLHDASVDCASEVGEGLSLLQHRGQDACGIVTCGAKGRFFQCKANGMVRDVFDSAALSRLLGGMGVGHGKHVSGVQIGAPLTFFLQSTLSDCRKFFKFRSTTFLCKLTIRDRFCARTL